MTEQVVRHAERFALASAAKFVAAIRARAWMLGPPLLFGLLGALIATQLQAREWRSQAQVYINVSNLMAATSSPTSLATSWPVNGGPRYLEAQATIARSPELAERVAHVAGVPGISARKFLRHSSARPELDADVLALSVTYRPRPAAVRLANTYADQFVRFKQEHDLASLDGALRKVEAQVGRLRSRRRTESPAYQSLLVMESQLREVAAELRATTAVTPAKSASSFRPHPVRNGLIGGAVGVLLGLALALGLAAHRRQRN